MFVSSVKNLGFRIDSKLQFDEQIVELKKKCLHTLRNLRKIRRLLPESYIKMVVNSMVIGAVMSRLLQRPIHQLQLIQNAATKVITGNTNMTIWKMISLTYTGLVLRGGLFLKWHY